MTEEEFKGLEAGDVVRHVDGWAGYIVHSNYVSGGVVIVRAQLIHNPSEWTLVEKRDD